MELTVLFFLSSGLFLGWSLGANDAANVFGTAVGSRMLRFPVAATICGVFVVLGAVLSGAGPAHGLGQLGAVNALPGSFMAALSAALTLAAMTRLGLPVSATQAIVGAIVGWNLFSNSPTDLKALARIVSTWVACPVLAAGFALILYKVFVGLTARIKVHLLWRDFFARIGLVAAGAFGAYSLGANNVANVVGVFVSSSPFVRLNVFGLFELTPGQQLLLLGGLAIGVGVFYSRRVMMTVGRSVLSVNPAAAWVVVVVHAMVLMLFSSTMLRQFLVTRGLPPVPLVPVSSSQAVIGALIGVGLAHGLKGARRINWGMIARIGVGWVATPVLAAVSCFVLLFFLQNVFQQQVYREARFKLSAPALERLKRQGIAVSTLAELQDREIRKRTAFQVAVRRRARLTRAQEDLVLAAAELRPTRIAPSRLRVLDPAVLDRDQIAALQALSGQSFEHEWQLSEALGRRHASWRPRPETPRNEIFNATLRDRLGYVVWTFRATAPAP